MEQFSRNVYRKMPQAFSQDPMALALAKEAVSSGALLCLSPTERSLLLLRNQTLGRTSSAEEITFLKQPGSGF